MKISKIVLASMLAFGASAAFAQQTPGQEPSQEPTQEPSDDAEIPEGEQAPTQEPGQEPTEKK